MDKGFGQNPDPKFQFLLAAILVAMGVYFLNSNKPLPELIYHEFLNDYLLKNQVSSIDVIKDRRSTVFNFRAEILMVDGKKYNMVLGSQESFYAKLDLVQRQMGKTPDQFIPVKYVSTED